MKLNSHGRTIVCPSRTIWTCATTCWNQCTTSWVNARCFERIWRHHSGSIHIIKVPNPGVERRNKENVRYLPHTAVIRQNRETTKLRIVYDGSAKSLGQGRSLNDCLPVGPNYIPHQLMCLLAFDGIELQFLKTKKHSWWSASKKATGICFASCGRKIHLSSIQKSFICNFVA